ncbi:MAG: PEP-CTERM sorting domain-containing protein [Verrucomicrobia bacterium]|nr:PEP-CTERM sorting domain-containing protein [Verrucomicrobiota bacterium]MDA1005992.1 PEP-CTERM sorting domain-containing protein [Verrucomicrobiota bacterium]
MLEGGSAGLFDDGAGRTGLNISLADGGAAPTTGGVLNFNFNGTYDVGINATILDGQWFGTGSAHGNASVQTVYERYDLVEIPEPSVLLLLLGGAALGLRRRRE